jgi:hypothetical protein
MREDEMDWDKKWLENLRNEAKNSWLRERNVFYGFLGKFNNVRLLRHAPANCDVLSQAKLKTTASQLKI